MTMLLTLHEPGETPDPHQKERRWAVGIDLGTTNSVVAVTRDGKAEVLRDAAGGGLIPSVVSYSGDGTVTVGLDARRHILDVPDQIVSSVKRLMGRGIEDVKSLAGVFPFVLDGAADGGMVRLKVGGRSLTPVEISADILRAVRKRAELSLDRSVEKAVITVPAYFDDAARSATKDAARLAGLDVLRLINEPTAAALAYGLDNEAEGIYAVYDLGGGTFDISILRMEKGVFQVRATGGDAALGGDDFDHAIAERFLAEHKAVSGGAYPLGEGEVKQALMTARLAKECLSCQESGAWMMEIGGTVSKHYLDRRTFEELISPWVDRTIALCRQALADAELDASEIKGVVLVGGSTRVPLVRRRVAELFACEPLDGINPDEVVAVGAALQAEALSGGGDTLLLDVIPLSLGLETMGGIVEKIIHRNTPIPVALAQEFTTYQDGQSAMLIHVVQGEREMADQCRSLARFELHGIPPMTAGAARIRVMFTVDADGLLTVSATEMVSGIEQRVEVKPSYGLTEDEMATMLRASLEHAREDMEIRLLTEARVEARRAALAVRSALDSDSDLLTPEEKTTIEETLIDLDGTIAGHDRDAINAAVETLDRLTHPFAERRMDRGVRTALSGVSVEDLKKSMDEKENG